ncbi:MAG: hypothetical protein GXX89_03115 [Clostridiales bacterium]|jgi:hypothetical protein|nr:hypothetical protein [Clostridiales bacterium]
MRRSTICWTCAHNAGRCPWSALFVPVPGWFASRRVYKDSGGVRVGSYTVHACPLYRETPRRNPVGRAITGGPFRGRKGGV